MTPAESRAERRKFNHLLSALDRDRNRAADKYELLRQRLLKLFSFNGFPKADDRVDETFRRVEQKLDEGEQIKKIGAFAAGVARNICQEAEKEGRKIESLDYLDEMPGREVDAEEQDLLERRSACLDECLKARFELDQQLILGYYTYSDDKKAPRSDRKAAARRRLADSLGISYEALRVRAHRVRNEMEPCVRDCLARSSSK